MTTDEEKKMEKGREILDEITKVRMLIEAIQSQELIMNSQEASRIHNELLRLREKEQSLRVQLDELNKQ